MPTDLLAKLDEIKALCDAATEGPWKSENRDKEWRVLSEHGNGGRYVATVLKSSPIGGSLSQMEDSWRQDTLTFIASSRTLVPKMERLIRAQARVIEATGPFTEDMPDRPGNEQADLLEAESALAAVLKEFCERGEG